jgi:hypothetical protein
MAGGGASFPRRTPVISGSGGALASSGTYRRGQGADTQGGATTRGARAATASPARPVRQAIEHVASLSLVIFKR